MTYNIDEIDDLIKCSAAPNMHLVLICTQQPCESVFSYEKVTVTAKRNLQLRW